MKITNCDNCQNVREFRRLRAIELFEVGWLPIRIAEVLGVTRGAVSIWLKCYREQGIEALRYKKVARKSSRLSKEQKEELIIMLAHSPEHYGYVGQVWTQARVAALIQKKFGVSYHFNHVGKILKELGWSYQKPALRATQRNEEAVRQWCDTRWPEIKKKPRKKTGQ